MQRLQANLRFYSTYFAPYRARALAVVALSLTYSLFEAIGIASLLPVVEGFVDSGEPSAFTRRLEDAYDLVGIPFTVESVLALVVVLFLVKCLAEYYAFYLGAALARSYGLNILARLFSGYAGMRWERFVRQRVGYLLDVVQQASRSSVFVRSGMQQISNIIFTLVLLAMSFLVSPLLTAIALGFLLISLSVIAYAAPKVRRHGADLVSGNQRLSDHMTQYLLGYKTMKAFHAFPSAVSLVNREAERRERAQVRIARIDAALIVVPELLLVVALLASVYASLSLTAGIAELGVVMALLLRVSQRAKLLRNVAALGEYLPSIRLISETLADCEANRARGGAGEEPGDEETPALPFAREIALDHVSFAYGNSRQASAIEGVDLVIRKGELVGVVGSSGAGKSTLTGLLLGLMTPTSGAVTVDGTPLTAAPPEAWLRQIGYVPQESFLLNDTIEQNIAFFRKVHHEDVVRAARLAHIHDFIEALPDGYRTYVGENGVELSGGERQRVCLARALVGEPEVLVLDEATSSLDSASERAIQDAIGDLRSSVTIIMVAHRLSTVVDADRIVVLERGRVVEEGSPRELLERADGAFRQMYELQIGRTRAA